MQEKKKNQEQMEYTGNKSKMADLNPVILLVTLHRNGPNTPLKAEVVRLDKKARYAIYKKPTLTRNTRRSKKNRVNHIDSNSKKIRVAIFILNIVISRQEILLGVKRIKVIKRT